MEPGASAHRPGATDIEEAIEERAFHLEYQPIVHLDSGDIAGVEALCRFDRGGSPQQWFEAAEGLGRADALDCAVVAALAADVPHLPGGYVALNVSPSTLVCPEFPRALADALPLDRLVLEVTEHAIVADYAVTGTLLDELRRAGVRLAVDDAGAGYSTLRHVLQLRPDIIKMDLSITRTVDRDPARRALASALVMFAGEIGATVVAEGAETEAEVLALRSAGVHRGQGYYLAPPQPLPLSALRYRPLPLHELVEAARSMSSQDWVHADTSVGVTAHGLLSAAGAIEATLTMLRARGRQLPAEEYDALLSVTERQIRHLSGVLRDLVRGLPGEVIMMLDDLGR